MEEVIRDGTSESAREVCNENCTMGADKRLIVPMVAGIGLGAWGVSRRGLAGKVLAAAGGYLAYRTASRLRPYRVSVVVAQTISRPVNEVYQFCREPQNWPPAFVQSWKLRGGQNGETSGRDWLSGQQWQPKIHEEQENELITWHSAPGSKIHHRGTARFHPAPGNRGTELNISLYWEAPIGLLGRALGLAFGLDPEQQVRERLRAFKALMETGEVPTTAGQPSGRRGMRGKLLKTMYRETQRELAA
jgi:uncharacterized membrane protein